MPGDDFVPWLDLLRHQRDGMSGGFGIMIASVFPQSGGGVTKGVWGQLTPVALNILRRRTAFRFCQSNHAPPISPVSHDDGRCHFNSRIPAQISLHPPALLLN
jgi:hypothetical protein